MICDRRTFFVTASGLALGTRMASAAVQGANDRIRIGVIGTGGRARGLMNHLKKLPGNEMTAICDVYEPRLLQAAEIAGAAALKVADYRRILDNREIDAVVIGTPDHWHKTITLDAVAAGKDVYVEKPVSHTIDEGAEMVKADRGVEADRADRHAAAQLGALGARQADHRLRQARPDHVRPDLLVSARDAPATTRRSRMDKLDWKRWLGPAPDQPFRPERFYQWRHFWDFGGGCLTDLMTHWIDVVHWYMDVEAPLSAATHRPQLQHQAVGGARHRHHDARVPEELHGGVPRHLRQPRRRRRARVPRRARHAEDRSGAAGVLSRRCGVRAGHARRRSPRSSSDRAATARSRTCRTGSTASAAARRRTRTSASRTRRRARRTSPTPLCKPASRCAGTTRRSRSSRRDPGIHLFRV